MLKEAEEYIAWGNNIVIKIVIRRRNENSQNVSKQQYKANVTVTFSPLQALVAAKQGAFISPFVGRLDDIGHFGMDLIEQIRRIYDNYEYDTKLYRQCKNFNPHTRFCVNGCRRCYCSTSNIVRVI